MPGYLRRGEFEQPIVQALREMGGQGRITDVLARVAVIMRSRFTDADYAPGPGTWQDRPRWQLEARWARDRLGKAGVILPSTESGHGVWRLAEPDLDGTPPGVKGRTRRQDVQPPTPVRSRRQTADIGNTPIDQDTKPEIRWTHNAEQEFRTQFADWAHLPNMQAIIREYIERTMCAARDLQAAGFIRETAEMRASGERTGNKETIRLAAARERNFQPGKRIVGIGDVLDASHYLKEEIRPESEADALTIGELEKAITLQEGG